MSTMDVARQLEAKDLAKAKNWTQIVLQDWDFLTWDDLLTDGVTLSIRLGSIGIDRIGDLERIPVM